MRRSLGFLAACMTLFALATPTPAKATTVWYWSWDCGCYVAYQPVVYTVAYAWPAYAYAYYARPAYAYAYVPGISRRWVHSR